jgi:hypothetical protein
MLKTIKRRVLVASLRVVLRGMLKALDYLE